MQKRVLIAMSGGLDSSVAAYLLKKEDYDTAGITMITGFGTAQDKDEDNNTRDIRDAERVCRTLDIPHHVIDCSSEMERLVIQPFIQEYMKGRTPNPCVICNKRIKFGLLLEKAKALGYDAIATGHYAGKVLINDKYFIKRAKDNNKDQSYFLYTLTHNELRKIIFPLMEYRKDEVRAIAAEAGLPVSSRRESQDICFFTGEDSTAFFNNRKIKGIPGDITDMEGKIIGKHKGIVFYTVGQRRGLGISSPDPLYVISIDAQNNRLIAGWKRYLKADRLAASVVHFNTEFAEDKVYGKIRYAHKPAECTYILASNMLKIFFNEPQEAITPGQSVVLYSNDIVLGGGIIDRIL